MLIILSLEFLKFSMSENCATKACGAVPVEDLTIADMQKAIEERFAPVTHCEVDDLGTCGTSYKVIIVSVSLTYAC